MIPVLSTNFGFSSSMIPPSFKATASGRCHGLYPEDIATCGSYGGAEREIVALSPEAGRIAPNQFQSDSHISSFVSHRHNPCTRGEYPTGTQIYQHWPLEYPRAAPVQNQTDHNSLGTSAFSHSQYYGAPISGGAFNTAMPTLGFASQWSTSQNQVNRQRKKRIPYSKLQITELEKAFENNRFLTPEIRLNISLKLGLTERQVKIWFQNQRQKEKKLLRVQQPVNPGGSGL
uniref:Homeobox protein Hox-C11-like n=1 Tax=Callorhinchus milii TaxID=7868 RepID=A0A4W3JBR9_CALMI